MSVGQAGGAFHTMSVLQAYQADLLMDLDLGEGFFSRCNPGAQLCDRPCPPYYQEDDLCRGPLDCCHGHHGEASIA